MTGLPRGGAAPRIVTRCGLAALVALAVLSVLTSPRSPALAQEEQAQSEPQQNVPAAAQADAQSQQAPAQSDPAQNEVRAVLAQYGTFVQHPRYGEVWQPTGTPLGWHPYPPCHWVNTRQLGWYFDDRTPWGRIVHHYGRWAHDGQMGWIWVPGSQFSPGWVVWRSRPDWIGWAPMPPDEDVQTISADRFNNDEFWIFVETAKFVRGCSGDLVAPRARTATLLRDTKYVTALRYVSGIAIFVLPTYVVGPLVDVEVVFEPWPAGFFTQIVIDWNWVWHHTVVFELVKVCTPLAPH